MDVIHIFIILSYSSSTRSNTHLYRIHHNKKEGGLQEAEGLLAVVDDVALLHRHEQLPLDQHHQEDEVQRRVQHHLVQNE